MEKWQLFFLGLWAGVVLGLWAGVVLGVFLIAFGQEWWGKR